MISSNPSLQTPPLTTPLVVMPIFGTRPEAVKMAPLVNLLLSRPHDFRCVVCVTAQHRQMLDQVLHAFNIVPDFDLDIMQSGQTLTQVTTRALEGLEKVLGEVRPDIVLAQGDTTTVLAAALAASYQKIAFGHVEAGLRTDNKFDPFPEEINRRLTGQLTDLHFAPTSRARDNLQREGVRAESIYLTGNTVIDALRQVARNAQSTNAPTHVAPQDTTNAAVSSATSSSAAPLGSAASGATSSSATDFSVATTSASASISSDAASTSASTASAETAAPAVPAFATVPDASQAKFLRTILVTTHRRENWGAPLEGIALALHDLVERFADTQIILPMHKNPVVREPLERILGSHPRVQLIEPPDYLDFVRLMEDAYLVLTDSGGVQEEAPALGLPVLVMRRTTERPEGVSAGTARLVGTGREDIVREASLLLSSQNAYNAMSHAANPYGDGRAGERIAQAILHWAGRAERPADFEF